MILDELLLFSIPKASPIYRMYIEVTKPDPGERSGEVIGECIREMINTAYVAGLMGDVWRLGLTHLLVNSENPYSLSCERNRQAGDALTEFALHDVAIIRRLYGVKLDGGEFDFGTNFSAYDEKVFDAFMNFDQDRGRNGAYSQAVRWQLNELSQSLTEAGSDAEFLGHLTQFYHRYGVGMLGLHKAFRVGSEGEIIPIAAIPEVSLDTLVGMDEQKEALISNTKAFLSDMPANNVLLYGEAGTGKSTSVKALANMYYEEGLRIIEIYKHQFPYLNNIITSLKYRSYKFILYMDDLSFEDFETEYKYLKAVIEGGIEERPSNILIYATSNRRHLIRETFGDNRDRDEDLHRNETKAEKLSLYHRFGITIYFGSPDRRGYEEIVLALRDRYGIMKDDAEILDEANEWELNHGGRSGRTARQFIDYLLGSQQG